MTKKGSASDRAEVQASINIFYKRFGSSWPGEVNDAVAETFATMMFELRKCSQTMALIPKPTTKITIKYVAKYLSKIIMQRIRDDIDSKCALFIFNSYQQPMRIAQIVG